ncbi:MAG: hypothetical protein JSU64_08505 [candidate division WOR-3 bacterium]|nr:MAG: hypothetical protein JSU64_08505 [candidate division WOR-3 bacterium]
MPKCILIASVLLAAGCLTYAVLTQSNTAFTIGVSIFIVVGGVLMGRLNAIFYYKRRTGKRPTEKQIWTHMLTTFIIFSAMCGFMILNIMHPTTPLGYFLRAIVLGFGAIGIYVIIKTFRKSHRERKD